jgi:hypothetical protein
VLSKASKYLNACTLYIFLAFGILASFLMAANAAPEKSTSMLCSNGDKISLLTSLQTWECKQ